MDIKKFNLTLILLISFSIILNIVYVIFSIIFILNNQIESNIDIFVSFLCITLMTIFNVIQLINTVKSIKTNSSFLKTILYDENDNLNYKLSNLSLITSILLFIFYIFIFIGTLFPLYLTLPFNNLQNYVIFSFLSTFIINFLLIYLFKFVKKSDVKNISKK